jgi:integrase
MTFLYRHNSGIWYYRKTYLLQNGKRREIRRSLHTTNFKQAQFLALKLYFETPADGDIQVATTHAPSAPNLVTSQHPIFPLTEAVRAFLTEKHRTGHWCAKEYRRGEVMLDALVKNLGAVGVAEIGRKESNRFKQALLNSDRSVTTINNYLKRGAMLFDWLLHRGDVSENPFQGLLIKQRRILSQLRDAYSQEDKAVFLRFALEQEEWRKWVLLLLRYTGARPSEICQLYKDDVDVASHLIVIHAKRPDQTLKTPSSARIVPIHSQLIRFGFLSYVKSCNHPRLFPALNHLVKGGYSHTFVTWFSKARAKAKAADVILPELYGARHTAATEMKNAGVPQQFASALLGHSNNSITYDRYGKDVEIDRLKSAVEMIGKEACHATA